MTLEYQTRRGIIDDLEVVCHHRRSMFYDMGNFDTVALDAMIRHFRPWLKPRLENGEYLAWLVVARNGSVAAGLGLWLMNWPPHMVSPEAPRANIINVYTEPEHRRRGLARGLMHTAMRWCRENGIRNVILHASPDGRPLYESLGFRPTNEMRMIL